MFLVTLKTFGESMKKLFKTEELEELKGCVASMVGKVIRHYREKKNLSEEQLGECLGVSSGMISQYENGRADINLSKMAMASVYCNFPLSAYFEPDESRSLLNIFSRLVKIEGNKYKRHREYVERMNKSDKVLKKKIYQVGDEEVVEDVPVKIVAVPLGLSLRRIYYGEIVLKEQPFTEEEFMRFLAEYENGNTSNMMRYVNGVLDHLGDREGMESLKCEMSEYVFNELFANNVMKGNKSAGRAYMYYRHLLKKEVER